MMQMFVDAIVGSVLSFILSDKASKIDTCYFLKHPDYEYNEIPMSSMPVCAKGTSRIIIVSDTHEKHDMISPLPPCDTLIHCGDVLMTNKYFSPQVSIKKLEDFNSWLGTCEAINRVVIGGNHDKFMEFAGESTIQGILTNAKYLVNQPFKIGGLSAWATPLSIGKSPNRAFQSKYWQQKTLEAAPSDVDILITHGYCPNLMSKVNHRIHIWGHSHNSYGIRYPGDQLLVSRAVHWINQLSICVPIMDGRFRMRNLPVIIDLPNDPSDLAEIPTAQQIQQHKYTYRSKKHSNMQNRSSPRKVYVCDPQAQKT